MTTKIKLHKMRCAGKKRYVTFCQGIKAADLYNEQMALVNRPMVCYWCPAHRGFHKGHGSYISKNREAYFLGVSRGRARRAIQASGFTVLEMAHPLLEFKPIEMEVTDV